MGSLEFSEVPRLRRESGDVTRERVRARGRGLVRFALIENEQRIAQAVRNLRGVLKLTLEAAANALRASETGGGVQPRADTGATGPYSAGEYPRTCHLASQRRQLMA